MAEIKISQPFYIVLRWHSVNRVKAKIKKLVKNSFIRNIIMVIMGTAGSQALTMLFSPLITRLYGVESFGLLGTFTAILTVLIPLAALSYPIAIVLPKRDEDAQIIARISVIISLVISLVSAGVIFFFSNDIVILLNIEYFKDYLIIIPLALFFSALKQIFEQWLIRKKLFKITAKVAIFQSLLLNLSKSIFGWLSPSGFALIAVTAIGYLIYAIMLGVGCGWSRKPTLPVNPNVEELKSILHQYRDFPLYRAPQQFINALSQSLPSLMLAGFFGPKAVGFYALSRMVMGIPSMLIGKSVGDVFYPQVTDAVNRGENVAKLLTKATASLAIIGIIPFIIVILFGPWLFSFIFGSDWVTAGEYSQWLSLAMFFALINKPVVAALASLRLQRTFLIYEIVSVLVRFIAIFLGFYIYKSDIVAIAAFSVAGVVLNTFLISYTIKKSKIV